MKLKRTTYEILQYLSTIDEIFAYSGDNVFIMREMSGSSFTEVEVKDFFNEQVIIRSLPKFLMFNKSCSDFLSNSDIELIEALFKQLYARTESSRSSIVKLGAFSSISASSESSKIIEE